MHDIAASWWGVRGASTTSTTASHPHIHKHTTSTYLLGEFVGEVDEEAAIALALVGGERQDARQIVPVRRSCWEFCVLAHLVDPRERKGNGPHTADQKTTQQHDTTKHAKRTRRRSISPWRSSPRGGTRTGRTRRERRRGRGPGLCGW